MNTVQTKVFHGIIYVIFLLLPPAIYAQKQTPLDAALRYVEQQHSQWGLQPADIKEMMVSDQFQSKHNQVSHLYFLQQLAGIEVESAVMGVHVKSDGKIGFATSRFVVDLEHKVKATAPSLEAKVAIQKAAEHLGLPFDETVRFLEKEGTFAFRFSPGKTARNDIRVQLMFWPQPHTDQVHLVWRVTLEEPTAAMKIWDLLVDATDGQMLRQRDLVLRCNFSNKASHEHDVSCQSSETISFKPLQEALSTTYTLPPTAGETYHVFPFPLANPLQGPRQLMTSPADNEASPYGWHDTDGLPGAEYTITRGNNVHAFQDRNGNSVSAGDEPNGGSSLLFDFPLDLSKEPDQYIDAAVTQLFYTTNSVHDFFYAYGFDEAAGNFQENNYGKGGQGSDGVMANAQDFGADPYQEPADPSDDQLNNANFYSPRDGENPRIQMYLFDRQGNDLFTVLEPEPLRGAFETGIATFGPSITGTAVEGSIANAIDNSNNPTLGCNAVSNASEVNGKIALIDRGECYFKEKTLNAQAAGAIAVIICNFEDVIIDMGSPSGIAEPTIPTLMLKNTDCQTIRNFLSQGVQVKLQQPDISGPTFVDGDLDNVVVAHEYGHGISNRLTGGPSSAGCLFNDENMGEGWSDFFSLVMTVKPGENGTEPKYVGSYVWTRTAAGTGVRRLPYATDLAINNQTFKDIIGTGGVVYNPRPTEPQERGAPHPLGEIWTGVLWDLYWAMVEVYDFDEDLIHGTGGNNMAVQLVLDGLKLQACNPGFIDGRDAILKADELTYNGENQCLIWEVFARRGLGFGASQGSGFDRNDGIESFEVNPACIPSLKIAKQATSVINPGEEITYTLQVFNHKPSAISGVVVTDILPDGTSFIAGSATGNDNIDLNGNLISFSIGNMAAGDTVTLSYRVFTSPELKSTRQFYDDVEGLNTEETWVFDFLDGTTIWEVSSLEAHSGTKSWYVENTNTENDQILYSAEPIRIEGTQPVLRFFHEYETETGFDGGFVEVSTDGGNFWHALNPATYFRGNNLQPINYSTFAVPGIRAFSGNSNGFIASYVDLSEFIGQDIQIRFRFGTDDVESRLGWFIDDIEIMDLFNYQSEACVISEEGDEACAFAPERGTVVNDETVLPVSEIPSLGAMVSIYPNPAHSLLNVAVASEKASPVAISLFSIDGKLLLEQHRQLQVGEQLFSMDVSSLAAGFYLVRMSADNTIVTQKLVIE